jgi:hypothetical protein
LRTDQVLTMRLTLTATRYQKEAELRGFMDRLLPRLQSLPGARAVGGEMYLPLTGLKIGHEFTRDDRPVRPGEELSTDIRIVAGDYFRAIGIPLVEGRARIAARSVSASASTGTALCPARSSAWSEAFERWGRASSRHRPFTDRTHRCRCRR